MPGLSPGVLAIASGFAIRLVQIGQAGVPFRFPCRRGRSRRGKLAPVDREAGPSGRGHGDGRYRCLHRPVHARATALPAHRHRHRPATAGGWAAARCAGIPQPSHARRPMARSAPRPPPCSSRWTGRPPLRWSRAEAMRSWGQTRSRPPAATMTTERTASTGGGKGSGSGNAAAWATAAAEGLTGLASAAAALGLPATPC